MRIRIVVGARVAAVHGHVCSARREDEVACNKEAREQGRHEGRAH